MGNTKSSILFSNIPVYKYLPIEYVVIVLSNAILHNMNYLFWRVR